MKDNQIKHRIEQLEDNFREAYILALESQANALKGDLEQLSGNELKDTRMFRDKITFALCDKATEYMFLKDIDSDSNNESLNHFEEYMTLTDSFMNKLNAQLACKAYF